MKPMNRFELSVVNELTTRVESKIESLKQEGQKTREKPCLFERNYNAQLNRMESIDRHYLATPQEEERGLKRLKTAVPGSSSLSVDDVTKKMRRLRIRSQNHNNAAPMRNTRLTSKIPLEPPRIKHTKFSSNVFAGLYNPK